MTIEELLAKTTEAFSVRRVFGDPVQAGETVVIPVCILAGGGGGGGGHTATDEGSGGGWGLRAAPAGVYAIRPDGTVTWHPAVSVNGIALGIQVALALGGLAVLRSRRRRSAG